MARTRTGRKKPPKIDWSKVEWEGKSNADIARELGCTPNTVSYRRRKLGIPYPDGRNFDNRAARGIDWDEQPLGKIPDVQLARSLGVHPTTVQNARKRRGLKPSGHRSIPELRDRVFELHSLLRETRDALVSEMDGPADEVRQELLDRIEETIG
jgi:transposase-like protein